MTAAQLEALILNSIYLSEANARSQNIKDNKGFLPDPSLGDEHKKSIINLIIEVWRIQDEKKLLTFAGGVSKYSEGRLQHILSEKPRSNNPRAAVDDGKINLIELITPYKLRSLPRFARDYPKDAMQELVRIKTAEIPKPPKPDPFHGRL